MTHDKKKQNALRAIQGRGWSVRSWRGKYSAYARDADGRELYCVTVADYREAVVRAIAYAVQRGTIGWRPTREYLEIAELDVSTGEIAEHFGRVRGNGTWGKGWSVRNTARSKPACKSDSWQVRVGPNVKKTRAFCSTGSERRSIKIAIEEAKKYPWYGEAETIAYLERRGFHDLVPLAKRNQKTADPG